MEYTYKLIEDQDAESPKDNSDDHESGRVFLVTTANRYFDVSHPLIPRAGRSYQIPSGILDTHHVYPLYAYIHSGVALSLGNTGQFADRWDGGQIGHVCVTKDTSEITEPLKAAEALIEEWNQYLRGDVWGYEVRDEHCEVVDSCWGFYGREYAEQEAKYALDLTLQKHKLEEAKIDAMLHL